MKLALVTRDQFGYHKDVQMYEKYLPAEIELTIVCLDRGRPRVLTNRASIHYVQNYKSRWRRFLGLLLESYRICSVSNLTIIKQFSGSFLLRFILPTRKFILDIRTLSVDRRYFFRAAEDALIRIDAVAFRSRTVISAHVAKRLGLRRFHILPLGCEIQTQIIPKHPSRLPFRLLYVGTLDNRNLEVAFEALRHLEDRLPGKYILDVVGRGSEYTMVELHKSLRDLRLENSINFYGYLTGKALEDVIGQASCGLVHVPPIHPYKLQPSTKFLEYLAAGLPVLCSDYGPYSELVQADLGRLYSFDSESLAEAIEAVCSPSFKFNQMRALSLARENSWENIVAKNLMPYLGAQFPSN